MQGRDGADPKRGGSATKQLQAAGIQVPPVQKLLPYDMHPEVALSFAAGRRRSHLPVLLGRDE